MKINNHWLRTSRTVVFLACGLLSSGHVAAQEDKSATLDKIRDLRAISVGFQEASLPFSFMDKDGSILGYSIDLCRSIVDAVKTRLNIPELEVIYAPTTPSSRQLMLEAGTIDLQCGSVTNTVQRQRHVAFSVTTFVAGVKALVRKESSIRSVKDMRGKTIVTTSGTTSDTYIKAASAKHGFILNYRLGRDHDESIRLLLNGQADAMVLDDVLLQGLLMRMPKSDAYKLVVLDENYEFEPYALMLRRNDPAFKRIVDDVVTGLMKSGELARLYDKWFMNPIPQLGTALNLPMSDKLKELIVSPNDKGK